MAATTLEHRRLEGGKLRPGLSCGEIIEPAGDPVNLPHSLAVGRESRMARLLTAISTSPWWCSSQPTIPGAAEEWRARTWEGTGPREYVGSEW